MEVKQRNNRGDAISIFRNDQIVDRISANRKVNAIHMKCFDSFDVQNDILELRATGTDGSSISVNLHNNGTITKLLFGPNGSKNWVEIDTKTVCSDAIEETSFIKIQNGQIIHSACAIRVGNYPGCEYILYIY